METTPLNRITNNPAVLTGKPIIRGMHISVEQILKMLQEEFFMKISLKNFQSWKKMVLTHVLSMQLINFS